MDLWSTAELMEVTYSPSDLPDNFWLGFFPRTFTSEAEEIFFDRIPQLDRRLAPFVAPNVQGRIMSSRGTQLASFKPAYLKPKHAVDPSKGLQRRPGEAPAGIGQGNGVGTLTIAERIDAQIAQNLTDERDMIERRWDWMACQAICFGQITISGQDYPSVTVDFQRDGSLTVILSGTTEWDQSGADPLGDLQGLINAAFPLGRGPIRRLVFGSGAWGLFVANTAVRGLLSTLTRGTTTDFNISLTDGAPFQNMGYVSLGQGGIMQLWVYSNWYEDETGEEVQFLDPYDVIGIGNPNGVQCFGAILDLTSLQAVPMYPSNYTVPEPSRLFTMTQSAPLMVPTNPNSTFRIRVKTTFP
jgi:hypothetical protein